MDEGTYQETDDINTVMETLRAQGIEYIEIVPTMHFTKGVCRLFLSYEDFNAVFKKLESETEL